jgi:aconitate hydratase
VPEFTFNGAIYRGKVYNGINNPDKESELVYGPNIADWPVIDAMSDNLLVKMVAVINDPVTTTDELIPSGETSSYRSNPLRLAEYALSRKVPEYVGRAKAVKKAEQLRKQGNIPSEYMEALAVVNAKADNTAIGSAIFAVKPGDGSAREQAASSQRVLGGAANFAREYATKRYRSNLINWGMLPFTTEFDFEIGDYVYIPDVKKKVESGEKIFPMQIVRNGTELLSEAYITSLTEDEKSIISSGCLMNYYGAKRGGKNDL